MVLGLVLGSACLVTSALPTESPWADYLASLGLPSLVGGVREQGCSPRGSGEAQVRTLPDTREPSS